MSPDPTSAPSESPYKSIKRLGLFLMVAVAGALVSHFTNLGDYLTVDGITRYAEGMGRRGPLVILVAGIVTPLLFLPRWPIAFLAGLLYGVFNGALLATVASTLGAWLHFTLSRTLLAPLTQRMKQKYNLQKLDVPREKQFLVLFLLRAFPLSNFVATNLIAGALKMSRSRYVSASFLGMIPSSIMYSAWGKLMKKPSGEFYALALVTLVVIVLGTLAAQRYVQPWLKQLTQRQDTEPMAPGAD